MYAKYKSHYNLWKYILESNKNDKNKNKNDIKKKNWYLILEDDAVIPDSFNIYLNHLTNFLNLIPQEHLDKIDLINISPYGNYTNKHTSLNNFILTILLSILSIVYRKKGENNRTLFNTEINGQSWELLNSKFALGTHAYLVNLEQIEKLINHFDNKKLYYHFDIQLNLDNLNIGSITPIGIKRGGFKDATTPTLTKPSIPVKIMTMFNPQLAHDLGKPIISIFGIYQINFLIILYGLFLIIWQIIDLPGRLQTFFENI